MSRFFKFFFFVILPTFSIAETASRSADHIKYVAPPPHSAEEASKIHLNAFGMAGIVDLPSAAALPEGEFIFYQKNHKTLSKTGIAFQLTPRLGFSFRYSGHGKNGSEASGRINHDRSLDLHFNLMRESKALPAVSFGLRDFIGTGWYSSEYIVGTKTVGPIGVTAGLGFGRLAGRNQIANPFSTISGSFKTRSEQEVGRGGTLGNIQWFRGPASPFAGFTYALNDKVTLAAEYSPDLMNQEASYLEVKSPYNVGMSYRWSDMFSLDAQYLHGSTVSLGAKIHLNPKRPPNGNGRELAPVPMRRRAIEGGPWAETNIAAIKTVLEVDEFLVTGIALKADHIRVDLENKKFRSTAQALGRVISTLQRFSGDKVEYAVIVFTDSRLPLASYRVDLQTIGEHQNGVKKIGDFEKIVTPEGIQVLLPEDETQKLKWSFGPYFDYKLFDPLQPIRAELGLALGGAYKFSDELGISSAFKKSVLTDLDKVLRLSNSKLPHVLSDFPLYDQAGQPGHLDHLSITHLNKLSKNIFSRVSAGYLEPMYAGITGEILYKRPGSNFAVGVDLSAVKMRDFNMLFGLRDYKTATGHLNLYYDAGGSFDLEANVGRYLAKDWGVTTKISRRFSNGWSAGAYATLTDVPFDTFGEGSFDKGLFITLPMDWMLGKPSKSLRDFYIRPITRDGGAMLASSKTLYPATKRLQKSEIRRGYGRMWK